MKTQQAAPQTVEDYIAAYPPQVQAALQQVRQAVRKAAPDAQETINYGVPTFVLMGNLVHFGAAKHHIGFYPTPAAIEEFKDALAAYKGAKGSVQFPLDKPMPLALIGKMVKFRVKQNVEKAAAKAKPNRPRKQDQDRDREAA